MPQYEEQIKRMMDAYGVDNEEALAVQLQKDPSTLRVWKSRDYIPKQSLLEASVATGYSSAWLCFEEGSQKEIITKTADHHKFNAKLDNEKSKDVLLLSAREYALIAKFRTASDAGKNAVEMMCNATQKKAPKP